MTTTVDGTLGIITTGNVTANVIFANRMFGNFAGNFDGGLVTADNVDAGNLLTANYVDASAGTIFLGSLQLKEINSTTFGVFELDGVTQANIDVGNVDSTQITQGSSVIGFTGVNGTAFVRIAGTQIVGFTGTGMNVVGNIGTLADNVYEIGNTTNQWKKLWANSIYLDQTPLTMSGTTLLVNGLPVFVASPSGDLTVTGNATVGNLYTAGTVIGSTLQSNVATGTPPLVVASTTKVTNLNADLLDGYNTSVTAVASTVVVRDTNANVAANSFTGNSMSLSGNAIVSGNLLVNGNLIFTNTTQLNISDPIITLGRGANNTPLTINDGKDRGTQLWYYDTAERSAFFGYDNSTGKLIAAVDATVASDIVTVASYGNLVAGGLEASTVAATTGTFTNIGGTLTTSVQPAITSIGTLTSLAVSGGITAATMAATTGTFTNIGGTLTTAAQPAITSVGTLTSLAVSGGVTAATMAATTGTFTNLGGTLSTAAQPSITSVGTLTSLAVSGGVTAATMAATTGTFTNLGGTLTTAAQPSITSVGTLTSLAVSGAITTGSINITGATGLSAPKVITPELTTGATGTSGTITGQWTLGAGSTLQATYADLAERYTSDHQYEPGTIVMIGGEQEVTIADYDGRHRLAGIVSTAPAYVLNSTIQNSVIIALVGRVPCRVRGKINKGDLITISDVPGVGTSIQPPAHGVVVGRALHSYDSDEVGVIEIKVDQC